MLLVRDFLTDQTILRSSQAPDQPLVSVILPTYCRGRNGMLERAIASVLAQDFADLELLVIDDGSTDGSADLIECFRRRDPRVVHVRHERNCGLPALRVNEGIELSRGRYIAFQFDDDCWQPHALQALVAELQQHAEPVVVVGHAHFVGDGWEASLPAVELNLVTLYDQNRFANNSVLFPRSLVEQYGMFDCHVGMRRLCDWDLWLRLIRCVPFVVIGDVISNVFQGNSDSVGMTVPYDLSLFRYLHDIPRNALLTPAAWHGYAVDALRIGEVELAPAFARRMYELQIAPFYAKFRHHFAALENAPMQWTGQPKTVLYTKNSYDISNDATLNHYDALSNRRRRYKAYFEPLAQVSPDWISQADALLLVRTVEDQTNALVQQALQHDKPFGYYLDDDLLNFHELGPQFSYLAPGTAYYRNLCRSLSLADTVWVTNRFIEATVRPISPRVIPHNNAIPASWLPETIRRRRPGQPFRIGYVGSAYRLEEFTQLWPALLRLSQEYGEQLQFEFWGLDVSGLPALASPVVQRPFTFGYFEYLQRLRQADFDILLAPLLDQPQARLAKSLIKYYETGVAGALGIFSDVPPYAELPAGLTCLKAANTVEAWYAALSAALALPPDTFDGFRLRLLEHVREEYTEQAQIHLHEAAWQATEFHHRTRTARQADGRPRAMYVLHSANLGGGEIQLWRRLRLARRYAIEPIVVIPGTLRDTPAVRRLRESLRLEQIQLELVDYTCFTEPRSPADFCSDFERTQVRALLERCQPALVHSVTFIPSFGQICAEMRIPHVASLYGIEDHFARPSGRPHFAHCTLAQSDSLHYARVWAELLGVEAWVAREVTPQAVFDLGQRKHLVQLSGDAPALPSPVRLAMTGTVQPRKSQLDLIEAAGQLSQAGHNFVLEIFGYTHFFPEYHEQCRARLHALGLAERVYFRGFNDDVASLLSNVDVLLSLSTFESFPSALKEAMAAGVLVVATPVGGVAELVIDGVSGILCANTSVEAMAAGIQRALTLSPAERQRITEYARRVARLEFHPQRAANDLLSMYNRALDLAALTTNVTVAAPSSTALPQLASSPLPQLPPLPAPRSHVLVGRGLAYRLTPGADGWCGLEVVVGTHGRPARGELRLALYAPTGERLRQAALNLEGIGDSHWVTLAFEPVAKSRGQAFDLKFSLAGAGSATRISLWETNAPERVYRHLLRRLGLALPGNRLYCQMLFGSAAAP